MVCSNWSNWTVLEEDESEFFGRVEFGHAHMMVTLILISSRVTVLIILLPLLLTQNDLCIFL